MIEFIRKDAPIAKTYENAELASIIPFTEDKCWYLKLIGRDEQNNQIIKNIYFDLCPECLVSLAGWLKNKPMTFNEIRHAAGLEPIKENYEAFIQLYSKKGE